MGAGRYVRDLKPSIDIYYPIDIEKELVAKFRDDPANREIFQKIVSDHGVYSYGANKYLNLAANNVLPRSVAPFDSAATPDDDASHSRSEIYERFDDSEHKSIKLLLNIFLPSDLSPQASIAREVAVEAAEGDGVRFLALLEIARGDPRDMLAGKTRELCAWQLSRWGLS